MKTLSFITLAALLSISSCSHFHKGGKSCCAHDKDKQCKDGSCPKKEKKADCGDGHCEKKKQ